MSRLTDRETISRGCSVNNLCFHTIISFTRISANRKLTTGFQGGCDLITALKVFT